MDTSLRIKFLSLLKKVRNWKEQTVCCIEIVPELSNLRELRKISSIINDKTVECTVPMTYRIFIRKQDLLDKVYHSCVDLLIRPSDPSNLTDFGSGDVPKIISENIIRQRREKYDILLNRNYSPPRELCADVVLEKTAGIQVTNKNLLIDKALAINLRKDGVDEVLKTESDRQKSSKYKQTETKASSYKEKEDFPTIPKEYDKTDIVLFDGCIKSNNKRKLSISPICSVSTKETDQLPFTQSDKSTSSTYVVRSGTQEDSKTSICNREHSSCRGRSPGSDISHEAFERLAFYKSNEYYQIYESQPKIVKRILTEMDDMNNVIDIHNTTSLNDSISSVHVDYRDCAHSRNNIKQNKYQKMLIPNRTDRVTMTEVEESETNNNNREINQITDRINNKVSDRNIIPYTELVNFESDINVTEQQEYALQFSENTKAELDRRKRSNTWNNIVQDVEKIISRTSFSFIPYNNQITQFEALKKFHGRLKPQVRVANFVQYLEKEIYPLRVMLNDIKYRCVVLGLAKFNEPVPKHCRNTSTLKKSVPDDGKSNRVVYTVFFNE